MTPSPYWFRAETVVIAMMAVVAVKIHEFVPGIGVIKPVFTLSVLGMILLYRHTSPAVRSNLVRHRLSLIVYLYFGAVCLTIPFALWKGGAFEIARGLLPAILLFAAMQLTPPTRRSLDRLQFSFIVLVLFFSWYLQTFGHVRGGRLNSISGTFDENDVASVMAMALPISIAVLLRANGFKQKAAAMVAILAMVGGVIATGSRGGTLALVAGAIVFVLGLNSTKAALVVYFMAMGAGAAWVTAPPTFRDRIRSLTNLENDYNTTDETGRKAVWKRGRGYIMQYPVFGVGAGNFFVAEGNYNEAAGRTGKWSAAHNAYIQAFAELGFVGGTVFVVMLLAGAGMALRFWRRTKRGRAPPHAFHRPEFLASLVAFAVGAVFLSHAYFNALFAILGFIVVGERVRVAERAGFVPAASTSTLMTTASVPLQRGGLARETYPSSPPARVRRVALEAHRGGLSASDGGRS